MTENRDLHQRLNELKKDAEKCLDTLGKCSEAVRKLHEGLVELKTTVRTTWEIMMQEEEIQHECIGIGKVNEMRFQLQLALDNHNVLRRQFDCLACMVTNQPMQ